MKVKYFMNHAVSMINRMKRGFELELESEASGAWLHLHNPNLKSQAKCWTWTSHGCTVKIQLGIGQLELWIGVIYAHYQDPTVVPGVWDLRLGIHRCIPTDRRCGLEYGVGAGNSRVYSHNLN